MLSVNILQTNREAEKHSKKYHPLRRKEKKKVFLWG
jgi:hypothetical protein